MAPLTRKQATAFARKAALFGKDLGRHGRVLRIAESQDKHSLTGLLSIKAPTSIVTRRLVEAGFVKTPTGYANKQIRRGRITVSTVNKRTCLMRLTQG